MTTEKKKPEAKESVSESAPETPSAIANAEVGEPSPGASAEELAELAAKWQAAYRKARRGF